ncbi:MAG: ATP-binding cassette domain-containing protein, partial [Bacillota bacterium]
LFHLEKKWTVEPGEIAALFGPSGSGKSLTIKCIAGLIRPDHGTISQAERVFFDSVKGINLPARQRRVGYVPQQYALFPHLTAGANVAYGIAPGSGRREKALLVEQLLAKVGLREMKNKYPRELSGGEKQRVALARALAVNPCVLLLDEPFSAVDLARRNTMRREIKLFLEHLHIPVVLVTHDLMDIELLCDQIIPY